MKANNPVSVRPVKVKSLKINGVKISDTQVQKIIWENSINGLIPQWEEIPDMETVELDTETVFKTVRNYYDKEDKTLYKMHQQTIPFPMDSFGRVIRFKTAANILRYCVSICEREGWEKTFPNYMAVLNQLDMDY